jgi:hypothetical protein
MIDPCSFLSVVTTADKKSCPGKACMSDSVFKRHSAPAFNSQ